jgi:hypothetical protein
VLACVGRACTQRHLCVFVFVCAIVHGDLAQCVVCYCTQRVGMESWVVCVFAREFFCGVLVHMKCDSMLIFLACCVQQIPTLLMALHHVLVCVCVFCDVCKHLCGCQGVVCVRVCARMNCVFELICFILCSR